MLYAMLAACATLIFVLVLARSSRGRVPSPGTPLSGAAEVGQDDGPPRVTPSATPPGGLVARPARWGRRRSGPHRFGRRYRPQRNRQAIATWRPDPGSRQADAIQA